MARPILSVIIPTVGRDTLARTLRSIRVQTDPRDVEILCVGDTHAGTFAAALAPVPALCAEYQARYLAFDGAQHVVGQPQRQFGMQQATGQWLMWSQDDSCWTQGAAELIRASLSIRPPCPIIAKVQTRWGFIVWQTQEVALGNLDADGLIVPNRPGRLGRWGLTYEGDAAFAIETVKLWRGQVRWLDAVVAIARPQPSRQWGLGQVAG